MTPASESKFFFEDASTQPSLTFIPDDPFDATTAFPSPSLIDIPIPPLPIPTPPMIHVDESSRGRSLSRSPTRCFPPPPIRFREHGCFDRGRTPSGSRSPSRSRSPFCRLRRPYWERSRTPSPSPLPQRHSTYDSSYAPPPVIIPPPPPIRCITPPHFPPPVLWPPPSLAKIPVDILTFHFNKNMAYAPAAKTYEVRFPPPL
jgi:hypothetical protein